MKATREERSVNRDGPADRIDPRARRGWRGSPGRYAFRRRKVSDSPSSVNVSP